MFRKKPARLALVGVLTAGTGLMVSTTPARADEYTDLLDILRAKGSLTQSEYQTLLNRRSRSARRAPSRGAPAATVETDESVIAARRAAAEAQAAAQAAQAAVQQATAAAAAPSDMVRTTPYVPGKGVTLRAGPIDINFSGFINGFYTYVDADRGTRTSVAGGVADNSGFDSSSIRNGLLPAGLIAKFSTNQAGVDLAAVFGVYPGINSSQTDGPLNANAGGSPVALGTSGVDFRQVYVTAGTSGLGTFKVGRDLGIFGGDAILSDQTLPGVGSAQGNANPANTTLGRIGIGYIYADFMPQISYATPIFGGFQATVGAFQPLRGFNATGLSGRSDQHSIPMFQGKVTYDYTASFATGRAWVSGLVQPFDGVNRAGGAAAGDKSVTATAFDVGIKGDAGPFGATAYYYRGNGVGTTGLFFDGLATNGDTRVSDGWYVQGSYKPIPKLKLVASYGQSNIYRTDGDDRTLTQNLVRRNDSWVGGVYYSLTDWMTLVGEYAHTRSKAQAGFYNRQNNFSGGTIIFF